MGEPGSICRGSSGGAVPRARASTDLLSRRASRTVPAVWIGLALGAGALQVLRNALAQRIGRNAPPVVNAWARFTFNLPFTGTLLVLLTVACGWPVLDAHFWAWTTACALTQTVAHLCFVGALRHVPFQRTVVLHKTEVAMAPVLGVLLFSEFPSGSGWAGIGMCALGAVALNASRPGTALHEVLRFECGAWLALGSGLSVALASFSLKEACECFRTVNQPGEALHLQAALHTLVHAALMQSIGLTTFLLWRRPGALSALRGRSRELWRFGAASAACSLCWFWAYSLALVAYVKALGQVELVVAACYSHFVLREGGTVRQLPAILLVLGGILLVLLG